MARIIKMPTQGELPDGPRRRFVEELRRYYRAASRPPLRTVSSLIEGREDLNEVTASQETVRRILIGKVVPTDWNRVNAIFQVFCELGKINPDDDRWDDRGYNDETNRECVRRLWDSALEEEPDLPPIPRPTAPPPSQPTWPASKYNDDPWSAEPPDTGFSDEPPF